MTGIPEFPSRQTFERVLVANAVTTSGSSGILRGFGGARKLRARLAVSALSGAGASLQVTLQDSLNGTDWNNLGTFGNVTGVNSEAIDYTGMFGDALQVSYVVAGATPVATFQVDILAEA